MSIVQFPSKQNDSHLAGEVLCLACGFEDVAVAPVGTVFMECPKCHAPRGRFKYPCYAPEGEIAWHCACGADVFFITPQGCYCCGCGVKQSFPW